ncbi:FGGY family carbohydrate kinase [Thioalkalivibrio sp.]|uniref:FGGY family carbohydrate kinase n=1 Tax=Thioalkalivibrio sp. TaxID=2093813 RepID=UPI0035636A1C
MAERYVLAIDAGTTGITALVFNHAGRIHARGYSEFTQHYPRAGWVEHDAEEILMVTIRVIGEALRAGDLHTSDLHAIGITNQRETVVLWEKSSGEPVGRAIVWQDRRTAKDCDDLRERGLEDWVQGKTGLLLDPYFSGTKLRWLLEREPGLRERARRGEIAFGTIDSWLVYRLTGRRAHVTDYSNASRTLLYNIHELQWDRELLEAFGVPAGMLPEVMPSSWVYGETDPELFPGRQPIPIAGIAGDQQAALFGQACYRPGMAKNTYGTGSFVLQHTGTIAVPSQQRLLTTIAWGIKDRKSNSLHRNIPSPRGPVKSQRKPRLSSGGSLCGRNLPAKGWRDGFSGGRWVGLWKAGNGGASSPGGCFTRTPAGRTRTLVRAGRRDRRRNLPRQRWHAP